jgi:hypothetical protein
VDITTPSGQTYKNCKVTRVEPDGVTCLHSKGIVKLRYTELPPEMRSQYDYDATNAQVYSSFRTDLPYWFDRIGDNYGILGGRLVRAGGEVAHVYGKVLSVADDHVLLVTEKLAEFESRTVAIRLPDTSRFVDDAQVSFLGQPEGTYQYVAVSGGKKQVKLYSYVPRITYEEFVTFGERAFPEIAEGRRIAAQEEQARKEREYAAQRARELEAARAKAEEERKRKAARDEYWRLKGPEDFRKQRWGY